MEEYVCNIIVFVDYKIVLAEYDNVADTYILESDPADVSDSE